VEWVRASYQSPYGEIASSWRNVDNKISWKISVPANTVAEINLKSGSVGPINGEGKAFVRKIEKGRYLISPGKYNLEITE
jgi:alpha-L-rhamnosidase